MFTWICPQCGREVPPAYNECPDCARRQQAGTAEAPAEPVAPSPVVVPPPVPLPPRPAAAPPRPPVIPPATPQMMQSPPQVTRGSSLPTWLMSILFAFAFVGLGAGIYWIVNYMRDRGQGSAQPAATAAPAVPATKGGKPHPMQKYIEVSGVRFIQNAKKATEARFVIVNHSPDDISDLGGLVTIWGRTQKSDEESVGSFSFRLPSIGPWESKEMSAVINTKLRVYELPDWQNVTAEVQLTSP